MDGGCRVPFHALDREYQAFRRSYVEIFERVLSHGGMLQGPEVAGLETTVAQR